MRGNLIENEKITQRGGREGKRTQKSETSRERVASGTSDVGSKGPLKMQIRIQPQKFPSLHRLHLSTDAFYTRTGLLRRCFVKVTV